MAGVILSGALDDGTYGMQVIKSAGGITIVQDPKEASIPSMPTSAIANVEIDYIASAAAIGELLVMLCGQQHVKGRATMAVSKRPEPQAGQRDSVESAPWSAVRVLEEQASRQTN